MEPKRFVFLDVDGVLNMAEDCLWENHEKGREHNMIRRECVEAVYRICHECEAAVVVSSTWRKIHPHPGVMKIIARHGINLPIIDDTRSFGGIKERGREVLAWLLDNTDGPVQFVILDDIETAFGAGTRDALVCPVEWTTPEGKALAYPSGGIRPLNDDDASRAIAVLNGRVWSREDLWAAVALEGM